MFGLQLIGPEALRYETRLVNDLELWRVVSAHWVHANWRHFAMNMLGLALCLALTQVNWKLLQWSWRILVLSLGVSTLFYLRNPDLGWYVGFSGVLFGLYVLAAVESMGRQAFIALALLGFIALKIALEQGASVKITSSGFIGVPVLVDAHLYGVLTATLILILQIGTQRFMK